MGIHEVIGRELSAASAIHSKWHTAAGSTTPVALVHAGPAPSPATVHIVAREPSWRAHMARQIYPMGLHAEVYGDDEELLDHAPATGMVLVHEDGTGTARALLVEMDIRGMWYPVVAIGDQFDPDLIVSTMRAGAFDCVVAAISKEALQNRLVRTQAEASSIWQGRVRQLAARKAISALSARERQVLQLMAEGLSNKEMARHLDLSPRTVEIHRGKMLAKLGAASTARAIRLQLEASPEGYES